MASFKSLMDVLVSPSTRQYIRNNTTVGLLWQNVSAKFWSPAFWLPKDVEWSDLQSTEDFKYPEPNDVFIYPLLIFLVIMILKYFLIDTVILDFLASIAGISKKKKTTPSPNPSLEKMYKCNGTEPPKCHVAEAAKELQISERQVERWLRQRHNSVLCSKYEKFLDCGFHLIAHTFISIHGIYVLVGNSVLWDIGLCFEGYPHHALDNDMWWYYMITTGYYYASTFMHVLSIGDQKSDATEMLVHHIFSILLLTISWFINILRLGTLIMTIHEICDIPLLAAKMFRYAGMEASTTFLFVIFLLTWLITRCYLYPFWILRFLLFNAPIVTGIPIFMFCDGLLIGVMILNLIWTNSIARVVIKKITRGAIEDVRSNEEEEEISDEDDNKKIKDD